MAEAFHSATMSYVQAYGRRLCVPSAVDCNSQHCDNFGYSIFDPSSVSACYCQYLQFRLVSVLFFQYQSLENVCEWDGNVYLCQLLRVMRHFTCTLHIVIPLMSKSLLTFSQF